MTQPGTLLDYLKLSTAFLAGKGVASPRLDAEVLLAHVLGTERITLYVHFDQPLQPAEVDRYREYVARRGRREPTAYIVGQKEFYSLPFHVSPAVLIPRSETELLVEQCLARMHPADETAVVDVGTGSGAVALTIAKERPHARVTAVDISRDALAVARHNAVALGVQDQVRFVYGDGLQPVGGEQFDVVVSNPPYIKSADIDKLEPEITHYEPRLALDGGRDGLQAYRGLIPQALRVVRPGGWLLFEVGHDQSESVSRLARQAGWYVRDVVADAAGIDRVVVLQRGES